MDTVRVDLGPRAYDIRVGAGAIEWLPEALRGVRGALACVTDPRVSELHGGAMRAALQKAGLTAAAWCVVPRGERSKSLRQAERICADLLRAGLGRDGALLCVGGGVVGDLGGFAGAIFQRGIAVIQVPTTLLAQVDSSVGGKTGVNLPAGKNMVGAFHQPSAVFCDSALLSTLSRRDLRSGLAEAIKHGAIRDPEYFEAVCARSAAALARDPQALAEIVIGSCRIKAAVVTGDERESGERAILNFGHTLAHAIEAVAGYGRYRHGEAVAVGMLAAARIGQGLGLCDGDPYCRLESAVRAVGLPMACPGLDPNALLGAMEHDKKRAAGGLRWVLPTRLGAVTVVSDVPARLVREVVTDLARVTGG